MSRKKSILKVLILSAMFVMVLGLMMTSFAEDDNVAQVEDGESYPTLEAAITNANGGIVTLLKDMKLQHINQYLLI